MSNVTVQEALKTIDNSISQLNRLINSLGSYMWATDNQDMTDAINLLREYKAALSEMDKCEPVAYCNSEQLADMKLKRQSCNVWHKKYDGCDVELYTSPQPIEKCEPVAKLGRWKIDKSTGTEILTLDNCSVIEGRYANYIMGLLQKEIDKVVNELENTSPQPREWVGLSEEDIRGLVVAQNNARLIEDCLPDDLQKLADAITAKHQQLNTKG